MGLHHQSPTRCLQTHSVLGIDLPPLQLLEKRNRIKRQLGRMDARWNASLGQPDGGPGVIHPVGSAPLQISVPCRLVNGFPSFVPAPR